MGWQSSLLGSNVVSSYEHIDNLRNDLTAGKFWDGGGSKYAQIRHDGTDGAIDVSSGNLLLKRNAATKLSIESGAVKCQSAFAVYGGNAIAAYDATGTTYCYMSHDGTTSVFAATYGKTQIAGGANQHAHIGSGAAQSRIYMYDTGLSAWRYIYINNGALAVGT